MLLSGILVGRSGRGGIEELGESTASPTGRLRLRVLCRARLGCGEEERGGSMCVVARVVRGGCRASRAIRSVRDGRV